MGTKTSDKIRQYIKKYKLKNNLSTAKLSKKIGIYEYTLKKFLLAERSMNPNTLIKTCIALNISLTKKLDIEEGVVYPIHITGEIVFSRVWDDFLSKKPIYGNDTLLCKALEYPEVDVLHFLRQNKKPNFKFQSSHFLFSLLYFLEKDLKDYIYE